MQSGLRIGEVAERAGVSIDTIRYYEKQNLLPKAPRTEGGFRLFTPDAVERVGFIKQAQEMGLTLGEIKDLLTSEGGAHQCQRVRDLLKYKIIDLDDRMKKLRDFKRTLSRHLAACENELRKHGSEASCPVIVSIARTRKGERK